jgi:hypothetical protein
VSRSVQSARVRGSESLRIKTSDASTTLAIRNRIPANVIGGMRLTPILINIHVEPQIKQRRIQTSIFLFIKRIPVVKASSLREQTRMRYECFEKIVVIEVRVFIFRQSYV